MTPGTFLSHELRHLGICFLWTGSPYRPFRRTSSTEDSSQIFLPSHRPSLGSVFSVEFSIFPTHVTVPDGPLTPVHVLPHFVRTLPVVPERQVPFPRYRPKARLSLDDHYLGGSTRPRHSSTTIDDVRGSSRSSCATESYGSSDLYETLPSELGVPHKGSRGSTGCTDTRS